MFRTVIVRFHPLVCNLQGGYCWLLFAFILLSVTYRVVTVRFHPDVCNVQGGYFWLCPCVCPVCNGYCHKLNLANIKGEKDKIDLNSVAPPPQKKTILRQKMERHFFSLPPPHPHISLDYCFFSSQCL